MFTKELVTFFNFFWGFVSFYFAYLAVREWRQWRRKHREEIIACKIFAGRFAEAKVLLQKLGYPEELCQILIQEVYIRHEDSMERALEYYPAFEVLKNHLRASEAGELPDGCLLPSVEHPVKGDQSLPLLLTAEGVIARRDCKKRREYQEVLNEKGCIGIPIRSGETLEAAEELKAAFLAFTTGFIIKISRDFENSHKGDPDGQRYSVIITAPSFRLSPKK